MPRGAPWGWGIGTGGGPRICGPCCRIGPLLRVGPLVEGGGPISRDTGGGPEQLENIIREHTVINKKAKMTLNPFKPTGISHLYQMKEFIFNLRVVG